MVDIFQPSLLETSRSIFYTFRYVCPVSLDCRSMIIRRGKRYPGGGTIRSGGKRWKTKKKKKLGEEENDNRGRYERTLMDGSFHDVIERGMFSRVPTFDRYQPYQPNISQCFLLFSPRVEQTGLVYRWRGNKRCKNVAWARATCRLPNLVPRFLDFILEREIVVHVSRHVEEKRGVAEGGTIELIFTRLVI